MLRNKISCVVTFHLIIACLCAMVMQLELYMEGMKFVVWCSYCSGTVWIFCYATELNYHNLLPESKTQTSVLNSGGLLGLSREAVLRKALLN